MELKTQYYKFHQHRQCEFFPCHETKNPDQFNCLFCYCPLYALGEACGGNYRYLEDGTKDCSGCMIPHSPKGYDYIIGKYDMIRELARKKD